MRRTSGPAAWLLAGAHLTASLFLAHAGTVTVNHGGASEHAAAFYGASLLAAAAAYGSARRERAGLSPADPRTLHQPDQRRTLTEQRMELTKWPRLLVTGESITPEQAEEVLIRTANPWLLQVNDQAWNATVARVFNLDVAEYGHATVESTRTAVERYGLLELGLLYTSRISSSWIGGPHGWCDWDGRIGSSNYNIGKWPDAEHVTAEWELIARTFPYLDLTAQLITDEGDGQVAAQWRVKNGTAERTAPGDQITELTELGAGDLLGRLIVGGERGLPEDRLRAAASRVLASRTH